MDTKLIEFDKWWKNTYQNKFYPKPKELGEEAFRAGMHAAADIAKEAAAAVHPDDTVQYYEALFYKDAWELIENDIRETAKLKA